MPTTCSPSSRHSTFATPFTSDTRRAEARSHEDLKKIDVPTLVLHGDDDQIVPIGAAAMMSSKLVKGATLKVYPGAPHGITDTHKDQLNADLLAFARS